MSTDRVIHFGHVRESFGSDVGTARTVGMTPVWRTVSGSLAADGCAFVDDASPATDFHGPASRFQDGNGGKRVGLLGR